MLELIRIALGLARPLLRHPVEILPVFTAPLRVLYLRHWGA